MARLHLLQSRTAKIVSVGALAGAIALALAHSVSPPSHRNATSARQAEQIEDQGAGAQPTVSLLPAVPQEQRTQVTNERVYNDEAAIPPQCYTKTEGRHNPCYTCHQRYDRQKRDRLSPLDDGNLQGAYAFSEVGLTNHYENLFQDRRDWVAQISDEAIDEYVDTDNYSALPDRLRNSEFKGFVPDLSNYQLGAQAFDERGQARDGSHWVAFNYKPFPGTFWPTNGSTDDVVVRLPKEFREQGGKFDEDVYFVNLTQVELTLKGLTHTKLWEVDEKKLGVDLDGDGKHGKTSHVRLLEHYVGDARDVPVDFEQFPKGTELMHSVRYVGIAENGLAAVPQRMKELRYMVKVNVLTRQNIRSRYARERKEKHQGKLPFYLNLHDKGLDNALGWYVKGFIEDYDGELRPQTLEEDMYCMGCHKAIGTTIDSTFSMARKVNGGAGWGYIDLVGMKDAPNISEPDGEILNYLRRVGGGSEFRANPEMRARWFDESGQVKEEAVLAADVATLVSPTAARARELNKAYTHIVRHQSYTVGRDATVSPPENVFRTIDEETPPLVQESRHYEWDIRLDWSDSAPTHI